MTLFLFLKVQRMESMIRGYKKNSVRLILFPGFGNLIYDSDRKEEKETDIKKPLTNPLKVL
ncbi:hypothetical protein BBI00_18185 [Chryseobacterium arthrosphaerae]|uniref:Uncharacterized protein n=1 Tax=Chryseobacterium arthrosphaerae TaxID=651561 RepID=A0A1B8ZJ64_9FLAO|nr:hypothetical protein BBI00_18185 [Chryseobacterium arthrosphaerae]